MSDDSPSVDRVSEEFLDFYRRSIVDLDAEHDAGDLDGHDYERLRSHYVHEAAELLRGRRPMRSKLPRGYIVGIVITAIILVAGAFLVGQFAGKRLSGDSLTGSIPRSITAQLAQAREQMGNGEALAAVKTFDAVLDQDPQNLEALTYRGWLLRLACLPQEGLKSIDRALQIKPDYFDANFFKGVILLRDLDNPAAAAASLEAALNSQGGAEMSGVIQPLIDQAKAKVAGGASSQEASQQPGAAVAKESSDAVDSSVDNSAAADPLKPNC